MCRAFGYLSMVGRTGASKDAPVSVRPVRLTPFGSTTREISLSGGGKNLLLTEAALCLWQRSLHKLTRYFPFLSIQPPISPFWQAIVKTWPTLCCIETNRRHVRRSAGGLLIVWGSCVLRWMMRSRLI
ncbi:ash family protein [Sodalis ligni]|nr:ash family protein [Sodalis ligni]